MPVVGMVVVVVGVVCVCVCVGWLVYVHLHTLIAHTHSSILRRAGMVVGTYKTSNMLSWEAKQSQYFCTLVSNIVFGLHLNYATAATVSHLDTCVEECVLL